MLIGRVSVAAYWPEVHAVAPGVCKRCSPEKGFTPKQRLAYVIPVSPENELHAERGLGVKNKTEGFDIYIRGASDVCNPESTKP